MFTNASRALFLFISLSLTSDISPYKILGIFPFALPSHYFLGNELMKGLAESGHEATILTVFEEKNPPNEKYKQIILEGLKDKQKVLLSHMMNVTEEASQNFFANPMKLIFNFIQLFNDVTEMTLNHSTTQELIKTKPKYDVVIVTQMAFEALKALAPHLGAHLVLFNNIGTSSMMNHFVGNPSLPSLNPEVILGYIGQMTFKQRLMNTIVSVLIYVNVNAWAYPDHAKLVHKHVSKDLDLDRILYNVSLVLSNSHTSLQKAASSVPCIRDIGGFHVRPPKKLPEDLQKYLDEAKNGVIYFSMGSNVNSADLSVETRNILMKVFSKRKERILWKFEDDDMPGKPDNVKISKWLPQSDLLAHPNIKLFITHGGFLSTIETVYHGVPTVAIPVLGDQLKNANQAQNDGYAKVLDLKTISEESFASAIEEVISNRKYRENVKYRSKIFHDRQTKPMDEAVYWLEYIVRHNGAPHLRVGYLDLAWYQYYLLDVFTFIFGVVFLLLFVIKKTVCFVLCKMFKGSSKKQTKKVKKQ